MKYFSKPTYAYGYAGVTLGLVLIAVGGGYFAGTSHAKTAVAAGPVSLAAGTGGGYGGGVAGQGGFSGGRTRGGQTGGGFAVGVVTAVNGATVTLQGRAGDTTVDLSAAAISKTVSGSASDVAVGQSLTVTGAAGSDGIVAAQTVQIRDSSAVPGGPAGLF